MAASPSAKLYAVVQPAVQGPTGPAGPRGYPGGVVNGMANLWDTGGAFYNVLAFDADPTGVEYSDQAFIDVQNAILEYALVTGTFEGGMVFVPRGQYRFAQPLRIICQLVLQGVGGSGWFGGTQFLFDEGIDGVIFEALAAGNGRADWTVMRDIGVFADGDKSIPGKHGIVVNARCRIANFSADGVNIVASVSDTPPENANCWMLQYGRVDSNGGHGVFVESGDVNSGTCIAVDCSSNGGKGFYDKSFLNNTYIGCHADGNIGGSFDVGSETSEVLLLNPYAEGGQPAPIVDGLALSIGGSLPDITGTGSWIRQGKLHNLRSEPLVPWTEIGLQAGFANVGAPYETAQFMVTANAICYVKGEVIGGTGIICTLPQHPLATMRFTIATAAGPATVQVNVAGEVTLLGGVVGAGHWVALNMSFPTL
jgi:hypothetical protein